MRLLATKRAAGEVALVDGAYAAAEGSVQAERAAPRVEARLEHLLPRPLQHNHGAVAVMGLRKLLAEELGAYVETALRHGRH